MISWAWLAGFFDGEGSLYRKVYYGKQYPNGHRQLKLSIYQKDPSALFTIREFLITAGCNHVRVAAYQTPKPLHPRDSEPGMIVMWHLAIENRHDVMLVLRHMLPYLQVKDTKAGQILLDLRKEPSLSEIMRRKSRARWAKWAGRPVDGMKK